ncbi:MAG: hypothetical protein HXL37_00195 [Riemerella sp.]|nr:hypothetical protein [Riemerella sp.]
MKKQTFEKGDRVFDYLKGWGEIVHTYSDNWEEVDDNYTVCVVKFDSSEELEHFTKYLATKMLSFTEYTLQGFSQERLMEQGKVLGLRDKLDNILKEYIGLFEEKHDVFFEFAVGDDLTGLLCFGDYLFTTRNVIYDIDNDLPKNLIFQWQDDSFDSLKNPQHAKINLQSYAMGLRFEDLNK